MERIIDIIIEKIPLLIKELPLLSACLFSVILGYKCNRKKMRKEKVCTASQFSLVTISSISIVLLCFGFYKGQLTFRQASIMETICFILKFLWTYSINIFLYVALAILTVLLDIFFEKRTEKEQAHSNKAAYKRITSFFLAIIWILGIAASVAPHAPNAEPEPTVPISLLEHAYNTMPADYILENNRGYFDTQQFNNPKPLPNMPTQTALGNGNTGEKPTENDVSNTLKPAENDESSTPEAEESSTKPDLQGYSFIELIHNTGDSSAPFLRDFLLEAYERHSNGLTSDADVFYVGLMYLRLEENDIFPEMREAFLNHAADILTGVDNWNAGVAYWRLENYHKTIEHWRLTYDDYSETSEKFGILKWICTIYISRLHDYQAAREECERFDEKYWLSPAQTLAKLRLICSSYEQEKNWDAVISTLEEMGTLKIDAEEKAKIYIELAGYLDDRNIDQAVETLKKVMTLNVSANTKAAAYQKIAEYYVGSETEKALDSYNSILKLSVDSDIRSGTLLDIAQLCFNSGDFEQSVSYQIEALSIEDLTKTTAILSKARNLLVQMYFSNEAERSKWIHSICAQSRYPIDAGMSILLLQSSLNNPSLFFADESVLTVELLLEIEESFDYHPKIQILLAGIYRELGLPYNERILAQLTSIYNKQPSNFDSNDQLNFAYLLNIHGKPSISATLMSESQSPETATIPQNVLFSVSSRYFEHMNAGERISKKMRQEMTQSLQEVIQYWEEADNNAFEIKRAKFMLHLVNPLSGRVDYLEIAELLPNDSSLRTYIQARTLFFQAPHGEKELALALCTKLLEADDMQPVGFSRYDVLILRARIAYDIATARQDEESNELLEQCVQDCNEIIFGVESLYSEAKSYLLKAQEALGTQYDGKDPWSPIEGSVQPIEA
jgi:hypothetical protein